MVFFPLRVLLIFKWWVSSNVFFVPWYSPYPMLMSFGVMSFFVFFLRGIGIGHVSFLFLLTGFVAIGWIFDLFNERFIGNFLETKISTFFFSFVLMIISEICLFFSFFWAFFNFLKTINIPFFIEPGGLPLLKTFLLLSRGVSVTLFHRCLFKGQGGMRFLLYTLFLGVFFELCQINEYRKRVLCLGSFTYGTVFFMLTGLHGFHVLIGIVCLIILVFFIYYSWVNSGSLIRAECLIWYWHFVDIVWIFVYFFLYVFLCFFGYY